MMTRIHYPSDSTWLKDEPLDRYKIMKKCYRCSTLKEISDFYKQPANSDGYSNRCKDCTKKDVKENRKNKQDYYDNYDRNRPNSEERKDKYIEYKRERYNSDQEFREARLERNRLDRINNPNKYKARDALTRARRTGVLVTPDACEHCGNSEKSIQGHHWSYEPEHWLDVMWLCTECHGKEHRRLNELGRDPDKLMEDKE